MKPMFPKDLLNVIQIELEGKIDDMLDDPDNYGIPDVVTRDGTTERTEDQDSEWIKKAIARNWDSIDR